MDYSVAIFIDTSVQLLRFIGSSAIKAQIKGTLDGYGFTVTSLVVRQEFKRRFLTDVRYVRDALLKNRHDCGETLRYINNKLSSSVNRRKLSICLDVFSTGSFNGHAMADPGGVFEMILNNWLEFGLDEFDGTIGHVVKRSGCGCGKLNRIGPRKCSTADNCEIDTFISSLSTETSSLRDFLKSKTVFPKTKEIIKAEQTLDDWLLLGKLPSSTNPCLTVGDMLIALESQGIPAFYTQNARESQHFCCAQEQTMIVHRPSGNETRLAAQRDSWPPYS